MNFLIIPSPILLIWSFFFPAKSQINALELYTIHINEH